MSAPPAVLTQFAHPDPNAAPLNLQQLIDLLNALVSSNIQGSYLTYVIGSTPPGPDDHDKVWLELDTQGRPIATKKFYNGNWRRVYNGMLGEIRLFSGDPTDENVWITTGPNQGLGVVGGIYDGWHICNGKGGVPDLSDRFIIAAHMNNNTIPGWDGDQWVTTEVKESGEHTGGFREITLTDKNTFQPTVDIGFLKVGKYDIAGATLDPSGIVWGQPSVGDETKNKTLQIQSEGNPEPEAINIIPPFIALGYIVFVGYSTT